MKKLQLASAAICFVCFDPIPVGAWGYMHSDCLFECERCRRKQSNEPQPQQDLFEKEKA